MYTEDQIKKAFWKTFNGAGELWFPNHPPSSEEECSKVTESYFQEFMEAIRS